MLRYQVQAMVEGMPVCMCFLKLLLFYGSGCLLFVVQGSFDIVHVKDAVGHTFATRMTNVFVIGKGDKPLISLPKGKGVR